MKVKKKTKKYIEKRKRKNEIYYLYDILVTNFFFSD